MSVGFRLQRPACWMTSDSMKKSAATIIVLASFLLTVGRGYAAPPTESLIWKGHTWKVTNGGMAGVAPGSGRNIFVDAHGFLHLKITRTGGMWTAAEVFTTDRLGFGTYQWQIEGTIDALEPPVVLGLFPYGPAAGIGKDGENEMDTEFSRWSDTVPTNADFTFYPPTGFGTRDIHGDARAADTENFSFSLSGGTLTTVRLVWRPASVTATVMRGLQPLTSSAEVLNTRTYAPPNPSTHIPQAALPLGINFWCFRATPLHDQEVVIHDFRYVPLATESAAIAPTKHPSALHFAWRFAR
jgi:hypothetical protein